MKLKFLNIVVIGLLIVLISCVESEDNWITQKYNDYTLNYTAEDQVNTEEYKTFIDKGIDSVKSFFHSCFKSPFGVFIHPNRQSLDSTWQKDWNMPTFKSECWMVASGVATRLDMISPKKWVKESCEHNYSESTKTQHLITHELVHIYHGQLNISSDFSNVEGLDWFVEGLATYASGQCDEYRVADLQKAIIENRIPESLDNFWTGKLRYALSGSVVKYLDQKYGRKKIIQLLPFNKKSEILSTLKITEKELIQDWKTYIKNS